MESSTDPPADLTLALEKDGVVPIYMQLAQAIERRITRGELTAGARLESEAALCARFDISRVTARLAIDALARKGLVERKQGKGTYVAGSVIRHEPADVNQFFDSIFARGLNPDTELLAFAPQTPPRDILDLFGLAPGARLMRLDRLYILDGQRLGFSEGWMPLAASHIPPAEAERKSSARLLADLGITPVETEVAIHAGAAGERAAHGLHLPLNAPVLLIERNRYLPDGSVVEHVDFTMNPALYRFEFRTRPATG